MNILARSKISFSNRKSMFARMGKFGDRAHEIQYKQIFLKNNYSINVADEFFTNFISSDANADNKQKECLKKLKNKFIKNFDIFETGFEIIELIGDNKNLKRLLNIINTYQDINLTSCAGVIKCKSKKNTEFQLYLTKQDETLNIILVDLYHLGLPANNLIRGNLIRNNEDNIRRIYNKRKNRNFCISNLLK